MLRKKKSKAVDDVEETVLAGTETPEEATHVPPLWERVLAAGEEYSRELEDVSKDTLEALRHGQERLQANIESALQPVKDAETGVAEAYGRYLKALQVSTFGTLPGSQDAVRRPYEEFAAAYEAALTAAAKAQQEIARLMSECRAAETAAYATARERFAKAFGTYTLAQREAWAAVETDSPDARTVMLAAQQIYAVAAHAAAVATP